ncbi:dephospho-CoA kinase [Planctomyces sp. SH-PL62]|uniref:dephospho-CoA kinase n=1 Tax=Planctomyces sp. SH-PL62 TaxID=1636152 RepID=UPI00078E715C|nr:dephospho-CoA kinase [Planctomyces sp. SH-PL62]AMV39316.1 Dephospho-CoA kinase [Planctomyces sp. SH-PL62]
MSESSTTIGESPAQASRWKSGALPVVGLTGGVGGGKSAAAALLESRGAVVIDADSVGHEVLRHAEIAAQVVDRFGPRILGADQAIDRRALGRIVFDDPTARRDLEALLHPTMFEEFARTIGDAQRRADARLVVLDAAILLESNWDRACDLVVFVEAPRETRLARVQATRGWTADELDAREAAQWPVERKKSRADYVLVNDEDASCLESKVDRFVAWLEDESRCAGRPLPAPTSSDSPGAGPSPARHELRLDP